MLKLLATVLLASFSAAFLAQVSGSKSQLKSTQRHGQRRASWEHRGDWQITQQLTTEESCTDLWFTPKNGTCHCGDTIHDAVTCNEHTKEVMVLDCYCMTADSATNQTVVGNCFFNCFSLSRNDHDQYQYNMYHQAPSNCSYLHRRGTLCGECEKDYFVRVYSYKLDCIQCHHPDSWWLYIAAAFLPLTVFIIIILVFRISVVSPKLHAFVFFAQIIGAPAHVRIILLSTEYLTSPTAVVISVYTTAYGIWNLDFFRTVLPDICLHLTTLQVPALDYLIAVYPMLLMVIAYTLVELHGYGFKPVLLMWKPFHYFLARFRREWDIQTSIVDAFVTFFILSTTKILSVSYDLLIPTELHGANGDFLGLRLYYDPNVEYFKHEHLPYALLALAVLSLFILPFCLLVLSSFRCVRKCFRKWRIRIRVLEDFLYAFQQYYRDDSNDMTDCRWYAGCYILVTFSFFLTYAFTQSGFTYILYIVLFTIGAVTILIVQPYKEEYAIYNVVDCVLFLWLALLCAVVTLVNFASMLQRVYLVSTYAIMAFVCTAPFVYITAVVIRWMWKIRYCRKRQTEFEAYLDESLPDRIAHPREYRDSCGYVPMHSHNKDSSKSSLEPED